MCVFRKFQDVKLVGSFNQGYHGLWHDDTKIAKHFRSSDVVSNGADRARLQKHLPVADARSSVGVYDEIDFKVKLTSFPQPEDCWSKQNRVTEGDRCDKIA
ncbi:hypothetical protein NPIL_85071 [Nephila pilipes]|uniref:Uncharacterized protein n=1 Tax=Nephila pilipes TaxID=299642 RepID=A0A8X6MXW3_NEPPI|nr:hypothetical protein NPIL_85071 [Nephila pilipes]